MVRSWASRRGAQVVELLRVGVEQGVLVLGAADAGADLDVLHGLHEDGHAGHGVHGRVCRRAMTTGAGSRSGRGLRAMVRRPVLGVALMDPAPTKLATPATAGSLLGDVGEAGSAAPACAGMEALWRGLGDGDDDAGVLLRAGSPWARAT